MMDELRLSRLQPLHTAGRHRAAGRRWWIAVAAVAWLLQGCSVDRSADLTGLRADEIDYNWHVRPILSENCFRCHGPDPSSRKAELRLDVGEIAKQELPK